MKSLLRNLILSFIVAIAFIPMATLLAGAADLPAGTSRGTFTPEGKHAVTLAYAAAFLDVKDSDKPVILILSDKKLGSEKWTSEFDMMEEHPIFNGVAFWFDKDGNVFRMATFVDGEHASVSGYFDLKLEGVFGKNLAGAVVTNAQASSGPKADATFHVMWK